MKTCIETTGQVRVVDESPGQVDSKLTTAGTRFVLFHVNGQEVAINKDHIISLEPYE